MTEQEQFLTAQWRHLAMLNFQVDPAPLRPRVPSGTQLDLFDGKAYVSLVGFRFLDTRVRGWRIPLHRNFTEVNLRFYVRREEAGAVRRGVVFTREIVPHRAIALVARRAYNEPYVCLPMRHRIDESPDRIAVEYEWDYEGRGNRLSAEAVGEPAPLREGSHEQFITEHYWGYTAQRDGGTVEYQVEHPAWRVWTCRNADFAGDVADLYGAEFASVLVGKPDTAFIAEGSEVSVARGRRIRVSSR